MAVSDTIGDFLTRIRNALKAQHRYVDIPYSKLKASMAEILKQKGLVEGYLVKVENTHGTIRVFLKYDNRQPVIQGLKRVSTPGLRRYISHDKIPHFFGGLGCAIVSTSQGIMAGNDAKKRKIGGELLCLVW